MTTVRTVAAHEVVRRAYPRPVSERDEIGMAVGKAIDGALSQLSHEFRQSRRPTTASINRVAASILDEELTDAAIELTPPDRERLLVSVTGVIQAFRRTELLGLPRPRSRMMLVGERAGVYAQPDFWNGRDRFYEMKSFRAVPPPPDIALQLALFQLAFPGFHALLACFDRHASPVTTTVVEIPPLEPGAAATVLRLAYQTALEDGKDVVLEYVDGPIVRYSLPPPPVGGDRGTSA